MAKKTFNNLKPQAASKSKPSDERIDDVLTSLQQQEEKVSIKKKSVAKPKKQKLIMLPVKLPEKYYNALKMEAGEMGLSMKHIIIEALNERLKDRLQKNQ